MTDAEIKGLIERYKIIRSENKIGIADYSDEEKDGFLREAAPHKAEILDYMLRKEEAEKQKTKQQLATFDAIKGVKELREARSKNKEWLDGYRCLMESGAILTRTVDDPSFSELLKLEDDNPIACFALMIEDNVYNKPDCELSSIWRDAYNALCDGEDPVKVKEKHDERMKEYAQKHFWG